MVYPGSSMPSDGDSGLGDLETQLANKEREWKELLAARVHQLESSLREAQEELSSLSERYQQLREDFQFNLAILDERDAELERYDVLTARALTVEHSRQEELNQLRIQVSKLEKQRVRETEERQEEVRRSAAQQRLQLDQVKSSMAGDMQNQMEEYERVKRELQRRIQEVEGELTLQRQEMTAAFDGELRQQEHEFNLKLDEMHAVVLSHDLRVNLLSKETEVHSQAHHQATEALRASEDFCQQIQIQLQYKAQEIRDLSAAKDSRVKDLEEQLNWMETKMKKKEIDHIKKYKDVVRAVKECDAQLEARFLAHTEQLQNAVKHITKLQEDVEGLAAQLCCKHEDKQKAMEQKDAIIQMLRTEVKTTQTGWDKYTSQVFNEMVVKDTEMIALQERESKLRTELDRSKEEVERYKQQLSAGLQRERSLEKMRVQVELQWQSRCEDMKAQHYLENEQLIQDLIQARDQATAELKEKEQDLQGLTVLIRSVTTERDQAVQGLTPGVDGLASEEIRRLQQQNRTLRAVVTQMRKDMEGLIHLQPQASSPQPVQHPGAPPTPSITTTAQTTTGPPARSTGISFKVGPADHSTPEQEVSLLKARCRQEGQPEGSGLVPPADKPTEDLAPLVPDSTDPQQLKQGLSLEKHANTSALVKQEVRAAQIESALTSLMEQNALVRQLQEDNLCLRQQLTSGLSTSTKSTKTPPHVLHTRLKQAASCIARLSRDRLQLIEMCNRLQAQVTSTGLQEAVEPQRDSGVQHDPLCALEQLQYQLTTQELQYAQRQRACSLAEQLRPGTHNRDPDPKGAPKSWSQGHKPTERPESPKNKENTLSRSQSSLDVRLHSGLSSGSLGSLKELWEGLDHRVSLSLCSEGEGELSRREVVECGGAGVQMMVHGIRTPNQSQLPTEVQQRRNPSETVSNTTKTSRPGATGRIGKIRNYNVKD